MAAGRYGVLSRRELYNCSSIKEVNHYRDGFSGAEVRRYVFSDRNGHRSSSVVQDSGSVRNGFYGRKEEKGQSESFGEDGEFAPAFGFQEGDDSLAPPEKRRKITSSEWHLGEKEVRISSKNRIARVTTLFSTCQSPPSTPGAIGVSLGGVFRPNTPPDTSYALPQEQLENDKQDNDHVEENFVRGWNITMSRWAADGDLPRDAFYDEYMHGEEDSSPESGEFRRESSEGKTTRSSESSGGGHYSELSSEDIDSEKDFLVLCPMNVDEEQHSETACVSQPSSLMDDNGGVIQEQRNVNMLRNCRSVFEFDMIKKINEGTYGVVYKARDKKTGEIAALKKVKMNIDREYGFPLSSLREINILLSFNHPSIVDVKEVVVDDYDGVFMVMEYMEYDLKGLMEGMKQPFSIGEIKSLMWKLLEGVKCLHDNWILHRDLKTSNILLNKEGDLKICDFGLSRQYGSPLKPYTPVVVTLWYRAPELLLGSKEYSTAIDLWSVGCIMAELVAKEPLFKGKTEVEQLDKIYRTLGAPDEKIWPGLSKLPGSKANFVKQRYSLLRRKFPAASFTGSPVLSELGFDLLSQLLTYDPEKRITAEAALNHNWFREAPLPISDFRPTFPSQRG